MTSCMRGYILASFQSFLAINAVFDLILGMGVVEEGTDMFHFCSQDNAWCL